MSRSGTAIVLLGNLLNVMIISKMWNRKARIRLSAGELAEKVLTRVGFGRDQAEARSVQGVIE